MDLSTIIGLVIGFGALFASITLEGGSVASLLNTPAAVIVFGGTLGAALISFPLPNMMVLPQSILKAFAEKPLDIVSIMQLLVGLAEKARREGLLALEEEVHNINDEFFRRGVMLVVDGTDPELVKTILETDLVLMEKRHESSYSMLEAMGGFAPTMGIIGTVMGLVNVLGNLEDPSHLGPAIATAFIATLYGVATANLLWLPLGSKLKKKSEGEIRVRELMLEGILSIQAGHNPRLVQEKLQGFLTPVERVKSQNASKTEAPVNAG